MTQHPPTTGEQRARLHELKQGKAALYKRWLADPLNEQAWARFNEARIAWSDALKECGRI